MKLQKLVDYFTEGIPDHESLMSLIDNNTQLNKSPNHQLLIFDDLLCDIVSRKDDLMQKLFTVYSNHKKLSVILLSKYYLSLVIINSQFLVKMYIIYSYLKVLEIHQK